MHSFLTAVHIIVCLSLVVSVLLQSGKGGGLAGAFGGQGGGGQAIFGGRGAATFLSKTTTVLGVLFLLTALLIAMVPKPGEGPGRSVIRERAEETQAAQPAAVPEAAQPGTELPGAGTLPGESGEGAQQESEGTQPAPAGGSSGEEKEKTDEG